MNQWTDRTSEPVRWKPCHPAELGDEAVLLARGLLTQPEAGSGKQTQPFLLLPFDEGLKAESAALVGAGSSDGDCGVASEATWDQAVFAQ